MFFSLGSQLVQTVSYPGFSRFLHPRQDFWTTANLNRPIVAPALGGT